MSHTSSACCCATVKLRRYDGRTNDRRLTSGFSVLVAVVAAALNSVAAAQERSPKPAIDAGHWAAFPLDDSASFPASLAREESHSQQVNYAMAQADDDKSNDEEEEEEEDGVTPIVEELFLGTVVYPQEQDEVQLTLGYFEGVDAEANSELFFEIEYGITDRLQIGFEVPMEFVEEDEPFEGVRNLGLELYYNFYNDRRSGRAYGAGFEVGIPVDSAEGESRAFVYEPFLIAYQQYCDFALNVSGGLEIEDPVDSDESMETEGEVALGIIGRPSPVVPLLECQVKIGADETPVRVAPGLYFGSLLEPIELAISFPVGLNSDAPDFAVFFLAILEFEADAVRIR